MSSYSVNQLRIHGQCLKWKDAYLHLQLFKVLKGLLVFLGGVSHGGTSKFVYVCLNVCRWLDRWQSIVWI